ncbi:uncharacterized protein LOC144130129 isoform X3 [Amblyomma americanum]
MIRGKLLAIATTLLGVAFGMPTYNEVFGIKIATEYCPGPYPPTNNIPVGCAYICTNQAKNRSEYGYYHLGTECKHLMKDGAYVLGTCKSIKNNGTICVPYYN